MATAPNYEGAKRAGGLVLNDTNGTTLSGPALQGASSGTRVKEIRLHLGAVAPGTGKKLLVLLDDGTTTVIIDSVDLPNTSYAQVWPELINGQRAPRAYDTLSLVSAACSIKFQMVTALPSTAEVHCEVLGANY